MTVDLIADLSDECPKIQKAGRLVGELLERLGIPHVPIVLFAYCVDEPDSEKRYKDSTITCVDGVLIMQMSFEKACREFEIDGNHNIVADLRLAAKLAPVVTYVLSATAGRGRYVIGTISEAPAAKA